MDFIGVKKLILNRIKTHCNVRKFVSVDGDTYVGQIDSTKQKIIANTLVKAVDQIAGEFCTNWRETVATFSGGDLEFVTPNVKRNYLHFNPIIEICGEYMYDEPNYVNIEIGTVVNTQADNTTIVVTIL